jgi:ectoine hydroxylase-related dioxygenase (phytanoyl-CoA dioxygenase family)
VHFDTVPGDVIVHHARTIHGAYANSTTDRHRRALSIRYVGDDARFRIKPGAPQKAHHASLVEGEPLSEPACPRVW